MLKLRAFDYPRKQWRWLDLEDLSQSVGSGLLLVKKQLGPDDFATWNDTAAEILPPIGAGKVARAVSAFAITEASESLYDRSNVKVWLTDDPAFNGGASSINFPALTMAGPTSLMISAVPQVTSQVVGDGPDVQVGFDSGLAFENTLPPEGGGIYAYGEHNVSEGDGTIVFTVVYIILDFLA